MNNGAFVAPKDGIYRFSFSANDPKYPTYGYPNVHVIKNHHVEHYIYDGSGYYDENLSSTWIWFLKKNDKVQFEVKNFYLTSSKLYPVTFTAELIRGCTKLLGDCTL